VFKPLRFVKHTVDSIMDKFQHLIIAPSGRNTGGGESSHPGRCPGLSYPAPSVRQQDGLKGRGIIAQPNGLGLNDPINNERPERAAYSSSLKPHASTFFIQEKANPNPIEERVHPKNARAPSPKLEASPTMGGKWLDKMGVNDYYSRVKPYAET
jgi:hypothetical protein